jgi:hypothetical protein
MCSTRRLVVSSTLALALLSACGGGGGSGDTSVRTCDAAGTLALGRYRAVNDVWHPRDGATECVTLSNASGESIDARFDATWPSGSGPAAFPHVSLGAEPWSDPSATTALPRTVGELDALTVASEYSMTPAQETALEIRAWVTSAAIRPSGSDSLPIVAEIWVHVHDIGGTGSAIPVCEHDLEVNGLTYDLHCADTTWTTPVRGFYEFTPTSDALADAGSFTLDLVPFLAIVSGYGDAEDGDYVSSVDVGVVLGTGTSATQLTGMKVSAP